jgi:hypothetical protein
MRIALLQLATEVGDLSGNKHRILEALETARAGWATLALAPELALTGYPPLDLLLEPGFVDENLRLLHEELAPAVRGITAVVGFVERDPGHRSPEGHPLCRRRSAGRRDRRAPRRARRALGAGLPLRHGGRQPGAHRPGRVQAPPGPARHQGQRQGLRRRAAHVHRTSVRRPLIEGLRTSP